jgi:hypothetical protein
MQTKPLKNGTIGSSGHAADVNLTPPLDHEKRIDRDAFVEDDPVLRAAEQMRAQTRNDAEAPAAKRVEVHNLDVLKTRGGQQLLSDPATGYAIVALTDHQTQQLYTVESKESRHIGEAQVRATEALVDERYAASRRIALHGGNFGSKEALKRTARCTAEFIAHPPDTDEALPQKGSIAIVLERPRGEGAGAKSFTETVARELRSRLGARAQIVVQEPADLTSADRERIQQAEREEADRYAGGALVRDAAQLAASVIEAGLNTHALPPEAFQDARIVELEPATRSSGERLIRAGVPGDFVYIPLDAGIVGQPIGDAPAFRIPPFVQVGATAIVRRGKAPPGGGVAITRNAEVWNGSNRSIRLLMIPAEAYVKHWHKPFSEEEFAAAMRKHRRYASLAESAIAVQNDFARLKNEIEGADPARSDFADLSRRLSLLGEESAYLLKQYELAPRSLSMRAALRKIDTMRKQIAACREFLRHFSAGDGAATVRRLREVLDPDVHGMSPNALLRVLRILLGRHASTDKTGAPNEAHIATVNDGVLLYLADLLGQLGQRDFDLWSQSTVFTDFRAKGRAPDEVREMETATVRTPGGPPLTTAGEIWDSIQSRVIDRGNPWSDQMVASQLFGVLVHGIYAFDVVRQALEPEYGLEKAKEVYEGVLMHHLTNGFIAYLFEAAGIEVDFSAIADWLPAGRAKICEEVHKASMSLTQRMRPHILEASSRSIDEPPAVEERFRGDWAKDKEADLVRKYLRAAPNPAAEDHLIARLQSIFDDVQQMTLLGLPKWVDIVFGMNQKKVKTNGDLLHALARGPVQEYGETNLMRGYGQEYVDASKNALEIIGIEHVERHPTDPRYSYYFQLAKAPSAAHATFARTIASDPQLREAYGRDLSAVLPPDEQVALVDWFLSQSVNPTDIKRLIERIAS